MSLNSASRFWLAYVIAALVGCLCAYAMQRLSVAAALSGYGSISVLMSLPGTPLGALAGFSVAFMPLSGQVLRWRFWVFGLALVFGAIAVGIGGAFLGLINWVIGGALVVFVPVIAGAFLLRPRSE